MRESGESAATDESQETPVSKKKKSMLLGRALVSTKGFQKTKRRGKQTWFIGDEYVLEHNVINVEKSSRNNQPWWRAAKKLGRPLRCPDCGLGPYAKIDGDDGHKRSSCTVANRNHKKQYDARKRAGITVNPFSLSQPTVQKKSPLRTGEPRKFILRPCRQRLPRDLLTGSGATQIQTEIRQQRSEMNSKKREAISGETSRTVQESARRGNLLLYLIFIDGILSSHRTFTKMKASIGRYPLSFGTRAILGERRFPISAMPRLRPKFNCKNGCGEIGGGFCWDPRPLRETVLLWALQEVHAWLGPGVD